MKIGIAEQAAASRLASRLMTRGFRREHLAAYVGVCRMMLDKTPDGRADRGAIRNGADSSQYGPVNAGAYHGRATG